MFRGGWRHFDTLGTALGEIVLGAEAGCRTFIIEMNKTKDEEVRS